jgi:hypothetical protein
MLSTATIADWLLARQVIAIKHRATTANIASHDRPIRR